MKYEGWPDPGELVVGKVEEIEDFGVFVDLEEYDGKRGLAHISEVASGWIKNISDHVREGQTVVAKVLDVDQSSQQIDLSIKDVNDHQRSEAIQRWKNEQKADKWLTLAFGEDMPDDQFRAIADVLIDAHGSLYEGFKEAAIHGEPAMDDVDLEAEEIDAVVETARNNVSVPYVTVTGYVDIESPHESGVDDVREALKAAEGNGEIPDEVDLEVTYVGAPEYRIKIQAPTYKTAESELEAAADRAVEAIESAGGTGTFHRERRSKNE
jgi:translation initiation factor 2 subunit 1